ncbi:MAG: hypothetical protein JKY62_16990 [Desulfocapsa sp.]|nr:hypothetical protein [Desulfocapsa sp.]
MKTITHKNLVLQMPDEMHATMLTHPEVIKRYKEMEETIEDMVMTTLGMSNHNPILTEKVIADLVSKIQLRINNHVRMAVEEVNQNQSIVVTQQNMVDMCSFAGMSIKPEDHGFDKEEMEVEYVIQSNTSVQLDENDPEKIYHGLGIFSLEYPEEGTMPLNQITE